MSGLDSRGQTWIDWFLLANVILCVFVNVMSLGIIWLEEHSNPFFSCQVRARHAHAARGSQIDRSQGERQQMRRL